jgi:hypothetical protein
VASTAPLIHTNKKPPYKQKNRFSYCNEAVSYAFRASGPSEFGMATL